MKITIGKLQTMRLPFTPVAEAVIPRTYSVSSLILMFFTFSGIGWIWEVMIRLIKDGVIVNRGFLTGPWLPIYGTGSLIILILLKKWQAHPLHLFGMIMLICGTLEYTTSVVLERLFGAVWWDYSDLIFQIHGRVCLIGLVFFGVGGLFIAYAAAPVLDRSFQKVPGKIRMVLCIFLVTAFICDVILSFFNPNMGFGVTYS